MVPDRSVAASASAAASMSLAVFCSALIASDISGTGFDTWDYETSWDILISKNLTFLSYSFHIFHISIVFSICNLEPSLQLRCSSSLVKPSALASHKRESSGSARASARSLPCAKCSCAVEDWIWLQHTVTMTPWQTWQHNMLWYTVIRYR